MKRRVGLLVMSYGTPRKEADILPYYTHIRRGYPPTDEEVANLKERYAAIGGLSPLAKLTEIQAQELVRQLNENNDDVTYELFIGNKHIEPTIEDAVTEMHEAGIEESVAIVMAPYFSMFATASYFERARRRAGRYDLKLYEVSAWNDEPEFIDYWAGALTNALHEAAQGNNAAHEQSQTVSEPQGNNAPPLPGEDIGIIFTAHSLPYHVIHMGDTYPQIVEATAHAIAAKAGVDTYKMAWQSAGVRGDWLTPDVLEVTKELSTTVKQIIYAPIGFVCDHLEILYDNDKVCKDLCHRLGLAYKRVPMPNGDRLFVKAMAQAVRRRMNSNEVK